jgi:hypothetical protein
MTGRDPDLLRELVREVLAEVLGPAGPDAQAGRPGQAGTDPAATAPPGSIPPGQALLPGQPEVLGQQGAPGQPGPPGQPATTPGQATKTSGPAPPADAGPWLVRLSTDEELHQFVLRVLRLADNAKLRRDLISGRARFRLAATAAGTTPGTAPATTATAAPGQAQATVHRVDKGAVTERIVSAAAAAGARLVLGQRAVLTPLARDRARALGVPIEKER